jgi:hypothetical protein
VKRISIYVQTKMMRTRMTTPSVIQVVPLPFFDTAERFFFDDRVAVRLSVISLHALTIHSPANASCRADHRRTTLTLQSLLGCL